MIERTAKIQINPECGHTECFGHACWYPTGPPNSPENPDKAGPCRSCGGTMVRDWPVCEGYGTPFSPAIAWWSTCSGCGSSRFTEAE